MFSIVQRKVVTPVIACVITLCLLCPGMALGGDATLKIGILPVLDTLPLQVAAQDGLFEEQGLDVELVPFASALERDTAMYGGQLHGYFGDIIATLSLIQNKVPMRVVTVSYWTEPSQRMFALVGKPGLEQDKTGLEVGISKSTIIEYLLDSFRPLPAVQGLELEPLEIKKIPVRLQMLLSGQLDAALLPEPLVTLAEAKGAKVLVADDQVSMPLTVVCLHQDVLGSSKAFMAAYAEAVKRINADPEKYRQLMADTCRIPKPLVGSFPVYAYPEPALPGAEHLGAVQDWMLERGMLDKALPLESVVAD